MTLNTCQETAARVPPTLFNLYSFPSFKLAAAGPVTIRWANTDPSAVPPTLQDISLWLINAAGDQVAYQAGPNSTVSTLTTGTLPAGEYHVEVENLTFASAYTITVLVTGPGCPSSAPGSSAAGLLLVLGAGGITAAAIWWASRRPGPRPATAANVTGQQRRRTNSWRP